MMLGVQTVCPGTNGKFGTPIAGSPDDCRAPALIDALPQCGAREGPFHAGH
jgi:hypothetical protein